MKSFQSPKTPLFKDNLEFISMSSLVSRIDEDQNVELD